MPRAAKFGLSIAAVAVLAIAAVLLFAEEEEPAPTGPAATLLVTENFGSVTRVSRREVLVASAPTAMRQLQSAARIETLYGGRYVQTIDGIGGNGINDWLFFVDGIQSDVGAAAVKLKAGQLVQWDRHDWQALRTGGAIVGAFPAPLVDRGFLVECHVPDTAACDMVVEKLEAAGASEAAGGVPVHVGAWKDVAAAKLPRKLTGDPVENGVFAAPGERGLEVLGADGEVARDLGRHAGLVAAVGEGERLAWIVTGLTDRGVSAAVQLLDEQKLAGRFAVAVDQTSAPVPLPVVGG